MPFGQDTARDAIGFVPLVVGWLWAAHAWGIRPDLRWTLLAAATFALWVATGYQQNWAGEADQRRRRALQRGL